MRKLFNLLLVITMCFSLTACGEKKVQNVDATDTEKQAVILAAKDCLASESYLEAVELYETTTVSTAKEAEITNAMTFKYEYEGVPVDFILFCMNVDIAVVENGVVTGFDDIIQFAVDRETGVIYDSNTLREMMHSMPIPIEDAENVAAALFCSPVLRDGSDDYLWSEMEQSTRFTKSDLKEINAAIKE